MNAAADAELVERYLGSFLNWLTERGPNSAVADNAHRAALAMVAETRHVARCEERERCAGIAREIKHEAERDRDSNPNDADRDAAACWVDCAVVILGEIFT